MMPSAVWGLSGLGDFSSNDLEKALAGKQCSVDFSFSTFRHGLRKLPLLRILRR